MQEVTCVTQYLPCVTGYDKTRPAKRSTLSSRMPSQAVNSCPCADKCGPSICHMLCLLTRWACVPCTALSVAKGCLGSLLSYLLAHPSLARSSACCPSQRLAYDTWVSICKLIARLLACLLTCVLAATCVCMCATRSWINSFAM